MPSGTPRRRFLAGTGTSLAILGGCLDAAPGRPNSESAANPTPTVSTLETPDEPRTDDLYVKNDDHGVERVSIRLVRVDGDAGETVLDNDYRFPRTTQMRIPDVGEQGATYELSVALDRKEAGTWRWDVRTCAGTEAPNGNRDVEVRIEDGEADVVRNACDAIAVESRNAIDHSEFLVRGTTADG